MSVPVETRRVKLTRRVLATIYVAGSIWIGLAGLAAAAFRCDESCFNAPGSGDWQYDETAWQWTAAGVLGVATLVLGVAVAVASSPLPRVAQGLLALQLAAVLALFVIMENGRWRTGGAIAGLVLVGLCGLIITRKSLLTRVAGAD
jgi:hypothetical protein